jgi:hypothetical protein
MSCVSGTNVVNDGLVFAFDMSNTKKSWKGRPTTNFFTNGHFSGGVGVAQESGSSATNTVIELPSNPGDTDFVLEQSMGIAQTEYQINLTTQLLPSTTYVMSGWYGESPDYTSADGSRMVHSRAFSTSGAHRALGIGIGNVVETRTINGITWRYCYATITTPSDYSNSFSWYMGYGGNSYTGKRYYTNIQMEQGTYPSRFVNGTRSNTEAIIDISGQGNTITANNPSYNSDGSFEFDSVNSKITSPVSSSDFVDTNFTFLAWVKGDVIFIEGGLQNMPHIGWGSASWPRLGLQAKSGYWEFRQYPNSSDGSITKCGKISTTEWKQIVAVGDYTNGEVRGYENGELYATGIFKNSSGNGNTLAVGTSAIATSWNEGFVGKIDKVKLYNRALSATEIKQNFEATRSIYGI